MENLTLHATIRDIIGKKVKKLRSQGFLPAILYGKDIAAKPLKIVKKEFDDIFKKAGVSQIISLIIDKNQPTKILIHEPQRDPVTDKPIHIDLHQIKMTEKLKTEIPLKVIGESIAVKELEGNLILAKDNLEVECLPDDLIPEIEVDITPLKTFNDIIYVKNLHIPAKINVLASSEEIIAQVTPPRSEEEIEKIEEEAETAKEAEEAATGKMEEEAAEKAEERKKEGEEAEKTPQEAAKPGERPEEKKEGGGKETSQPKQ